MIPKFRHDINFDPALHFRPGLDGKKTRRRQTGSIDDLEPPMTKGTLSELDVNKIVNSPKLRHDINFHPDLHFRPELDDDKERQKSQKAEVFWATLRRILRDHQREGNHFDSFDVEWRKRGLLQQFQMSVAKRAKLATWLSQTLKCQSTPMLDNSIDEMATQINKGDRNHEASKGAANCLP